MYKQFLKFISKLLKTRQVDNDTVSIVISAYLRADALNQTLQSVYKQTHTNWQVLIIADCCDDKFISEVDLSHEKVSLINLPVRAGAQYGPNSVGIHLSKSRYIAFLNHDDLWLADHLEIAIKSLKKNSSDFFLGKAAFCNKENQEAACKKKGRLVFSEINYPERIWRVFNGPNWIFEPASSWVVKTKFAKKVGYWHTPVDVKNTSVMDWLQRSSLQGAKFCFSKSISVLKINLYGASKEKDFHYQGEGICSKEIDEFIKYSPNKSRRLILKDLKDSSFMNLKNRFHQINKNNEDKIKEAYNDFLKKGYIENNIVKNKETALTILKERTGEELKGFIMPEKLIEKMDEIL